MTQLILILIEFNWVSTYLTYLLNSLVWVGNKWVDFDGLIGLGKF